MHTITIPRPPPGAPPPSKTPRPVERLHSADQDRPHTHRPNTDRPATERFVSYARADGRPHTDYLSARDQKASGNLNKMLEERRKLALEALNLPRPKTLADLPGTSFCAHQLRYNGWF
eukprot:3232908-Rhodomonas_salina.1